MAKAAETSVSPQPLVVPLIRFFSSQDLPLLSIKEAELLGGRQGPLSVRWHAWQTHATVAWGTSFFF